MHKKAHTPGLQAVHLEAMHGTCADLLQYVVDTHLDEVWHRFLVSLLADIQLLPNPYPRFLSVMRGCTMR